MIIQLYNYGLDCRNGINVHALAIVKNIAWNQKFFGQVRMLYLQSGPKNIHNRRSMHLHCL